MQTQHAILSIIIIIITPVYLYVVILLSELRHSNNIIKLLYFVHCMLGYKFCVQHLPTYIKC